MEFRRGLFRSLPRCRSGYRYRFRGRTHGVAVPGRNSRMRIGTERLIRALIGAGMVIGHEVGRDMTASRASRGAGIGCGAVAPVRGPLAARAIHAFVVAVAVHQLLANEGSGCGEEKRSEAHTS